MPEVRDNGADGRDSGVIHLSQQAAGETIRALRNEDELSQTSVGVKARRLRCRLDPGL